MKLQELFEMWSKDCNVDINKLDTESVKIPYLHSKYLQLYTSEKIKLRNLKLTGKILLRDLYEYYSNTLDIEDVKNLGLEPLQIKVIRGEIPTYIEANNLMINHNKKVLLQEEKVEALDSIIKNINNRGFQIKGAIDFLKFNNGY